MPHNDKNHCDKYISTATVYLFLIQFFNLPQEFLKYQIIATYIFLYYGGDNS